MRIAWLGEPLVSSFFREINVVSQILVHDLIIIKHNEVKTDSVFMLTNVLRCFLEIQAGHSFRTGHLV
jgi:hypothetical protein